MLKKFAEDLKQRRLKANIPLEFITEKTRIDKKYLLEIESGNFSFQPPVYIRAFVKSYAECIGLDPETAIKRYDLARQNKNYDIEDISSAQVQENTSVSVPEVKVITEEPQVVIEDDLFVPIPTPEPKIVTEKDKKESIANFDAVSTSQANTVYSIDTKPQENTLLDAENNLPKNDFSHITPENKNLVPYIVSGIFLIIVIALGGYYYYNEVYLKENKPIAESEQNVQRYEEKAVQPQQVQTSQLSSDSLVLNISFSGKSWVRVVPDDNKGKMTELTGNSNESKEFKAKKGFFVWLGNSGPVTINFNNKKLEFTSKEGKSIRFTVDSLGTVKEILHKSAPTTTDEQ